MSSIFDSMIPSRRREQKRVREEEKRRENIQISAPTAGCWIGSEQTPELGWSSPSTQGFASPDLANNPRRNSLRLGEFGEQVIIVDTDTDLSAHSYPEELEKNAITFTIPLPWPSRKGNSRSPSVSQANAPTPETFQRASPLPSSQSSVVYKPASDQYMRELGSISRGNSPPASLVSSNSRRYASPLASVVSSDSRWYASPPASLVSSDSRRYGSPPASFVSSNSRRHASPPPAEIPLRQTSPMSLMGFARPPPSPPVDYEDGHNISAIMLLSPVGEDFPTRQKASSTFSRGGSQRHVEQLNWPLPSPPPERPSTAMSSHSAIARSETGTSVSRATGVTDASYYTAITHHTTRSTARGPGLAHTSTMRSVSREAGTRREMSREPVNRRAMSREPARRRAMTGESVIHRGHSIDDLRYGASSQFSRARSPSVISDDANGSTTGRSYYSSVAGEYRQIAQEASNTYADDNDSMVGRVGKVTKEKSKRRDLPVGRQELVPDQDDLYS